MSQNKNPVMTREEAIERCKKSAMDIRREGIDNLVDDFEASVGLSDILRYPLDVQDWITAEEEPILDAIVTYAVRADRDHTDRDAWEKILQLTDILD